MNNANLWLMTEIKELFAVQQRKNLVAREFAVKIWLGAILNSIPERTLASILFQQTASLTEEESYQLVSDLSKDSLADNKEAIERAVGLIVNGLTVLDANAVNAELAAKGCKKSLFPQAN